MIMLQHFGTYNYLCHFLIKESSNRFPQHLDAILKKIPFYLRDNGIHQTKKRHGRLKLVAIVNHAVQSRNNDRYEILRKIVKERVTKGLCIVILYTLFVRVSITRKDISGLPVEGRPVSSYRSSKHLTL